MSLNTALEQLHNDISRHMPARERRFAVCYGQFQQTSYKQTIPIEVLTSQKKNQKKLAQPNGCTYITTHWFHNTDK
jgi:hypothetical protein